MLEKVREAFTPLAEKANTMVVDDLAPVVTNLLKDIGLDDQAASLAFERMMKPCTSADPWSTASRRGGFIVFEGLDRSGKSTQSKELLAGLEKQGTPVRWTCFPMRQTALGCLIDLYLRRKPEMPDAA